MGKVMGEVDGRMGEVDGRYSWVVCAVAFSAHLLTSGFSFSIGVYYVEFLNVFNQSKGTTAWVASLNFGILCLVGKPWLNSCLFYFQGVHCW